MLHTDINWDRKKKKKEIWLISSSRGQARQGPYNAFEANLWIEKNYQRKENVQKTSEFQVKLI